MSCVNQNTEKNISVLTVFSVSLSLLSPTSSNIKKIQNVDLVDLFRNSPSYKMVQKNYFEILSRSNYKFLF